VAPLGKGESQPVREESLIKLEEDLMRVAGIRSARVVGVDSPSEIHIIAGPGRSAKQLVRDVQSLASAGYGIEIDHRIVSVVQLEEEAAPKQVSLVSTNGHISRRPILDAVVLSSQGDTGWVKVTLKWPEGVVTEGAAPATSNRASRARAATRALEKALEPALKEKSTQMDIAQVLLQPLGGAESVLVQGTFEKDGTTSPFVGTALITDDVATAAVHALLQAINRKLIED
jgi:hypothetical protein